MKRTSAGRRAHPIGVDYLNLSGAYGDRVQHANKARLLERAHEPSWIANLKIN